MDKFIRVYSGGELVKGPNGVEFGNLAEQGIWFETAPTFAELIDAVCGKLGWKQTTHDIHAQGRMNVGGGAHRHFILVPVNDDKSWSSYAKAVFNGTEWNCLEIYVEAAKRSSTQASDLGPVVMAMDLPNAYRLNARTPNPKPNGNTKAHGHSGGNRADDETGLGRGGERGDSSTADPHYYPLLVGPYDDDHRARAISSGQTLPELFPRTREPLRFNKRYEHYLRPAALMGLANMCRAGLPTIDRALVSALVDRWRPETHTFHMPFGEITITLQDVAMILGLPIAGRAVTTGLQVSWHELFERYLGKAPPLDKRSGVRVAWLRAEFDNCPEDADEETIKRHARAYILSLIGGVLFPDATGDIYTCLPFPLIADLEHVGLYSWGSATLAYLYRAMCEACRRQGDQSNLTGCLLLLQLWSWERFPIGRPELVNLKYPNVEDERDRPTVGLRWVVGVNLLRAAPVRCYEHFTNEFDLMMEDQVIWYPYRPERVEELQLAPICTLAQHLWLTRAPLIYFFVVEVYTPERVMRQFGLHQEFPPTLRDTSENLHRYSRRGRQNENWAEKHMTYVDIWEANAQHIILEDRPYNHAHYKDYMRWYRRSTRTRLCPPKRMHNDHEARASGGASAPPKESGCTPQLRYTPRAHLIHSVTDKLTILAKDAANKKGCFTGESHAFVERVLSTCRDVIEELGGASLCDFADVIPCSVTTASVAAEREVDRQREDEECINDCTVSVAMHDKQTLSLLSQAPEPAQSISAPADSTVPSKVAGKRKRVKSVRRAGK